MSTSSFYTSSGTSQTLERSVADAAEDAEKLAINAEDSQYTLSDGTTGYSALHYHAKAEDEKIAAQTAKTAAETARDTAQDHRDDAQKLALNAEDSQFTLADGVTTGYSALHYYEKALDAKTAAETAKSGAQTSETNAASSAGDAADDAADAQKLAINAEDSQYTLSDGTTTGYSALHYAAKAEDHKTAAQAAQAAAEAALDTFDDAFIGAKDTSSGFPTVDNDGNALQDGALMFSTTTDIMYVYDLANTQWLQLTLTSANQTNVNTVAGQISPTNNIATVAGDSASISAVAGNSTNINAVANNATNINTVAGANTNINTVATNIADVNSFADTYFIGATAPSSPTTGDLWFDSSSNTMKVYGSSGFQNAGSSVNGTAERQSYTATAGQTSFAATYDAGYVDVYLNGVKLIDGTDFTATNGTSIVLSSGAALNDTVDIVAYGTFELSNFSINDANDVNTSGVTNGQVLAYNSTTSDFEPSTVDLTNLSASNLTSGTIPAARFPSALPAVDGSALTGINTDLVADASPQLGADLDANSNDILMGNQSIKFGTSKWEIVLDTADNDLNFKYNGTTVFKLSSAGAVVAADNISAFGTP